MPAPAPTTTVSYVTLMVAITAKARAMMGSTYVDKIKVDVALVNQGLANSRVPMRIRLVGITGVQAAYDERAMQPPFSAETEKWVASAANALAHCIVSATALLDVDAVVMDGSFCRPLLQRLIGSTDAALTGYNWEGMWRSRLIAGSIGSDARALGGALLPLHANFAPDRDLFLKAGA